jgi:chaperonin GroEL
MGSRALTWVAVQAHHFGRVGEVTITKDDTLMLNGAGRKEDIEDRATEIKSQIEETKSDYEKEKLNVWLQQWLAVCD